VEGMSKSEGVRGVEGKIDSPGVYGGVQNETGQLGLGACQFGESEHFNALGWSTLGSTSPRALEWQVLGGKGLCKVLL
jgi:hypothetical protein